MTTSVDEKLYQQYLKESGVKRSSQPSLFSFKPTEKLRNSGLTPDEERELVLFCLADDYPREHVVERTSTRYRLGTPEAARLLLSNLRYGNKDVRVAVTSPNQLSLR